MLEIDKNHKENLNQLKIIIIKKWNKSRMKEKTIIYDIKKK